MATQAREEWGSRLGFLMAAIGSAVGLGNMWRFSYLTAEHGGAAFVILYVAMVVLLGLPILLAELVIGRGAHAGPVRALAHYGGNAWRPLGALFVASGFLIGSYYSVIAGWTLRYTLEALFVGFAADPGGHFGAVSQGNAATLWHLIFMAISLSIVAGGIKGGIERTSVIVMPVLFAVVCGLAIYASTLPGSTPGYAYYFKTNLAAIFSREVLAQAAGQAFFSLSLGMGAMLTYASYLSRSTQLVGQAAIIAGADFAVAFVAGLVVFPLLFALGLSGKVGESTIGALFITLPEAFAQMGAAGRLIGIAFFGSLVVGALTSLISLLEVVVSASLDVVGWTRRRATMIVGGATALFGIPASQNIQILGIMDTIANKIFLVGGGLALSVFVGWVMRDPLREASSAGEPVAVLRVWLLLLRYVVPLVLLFILLGTIPETWHEIAALFGP
jgi:NSS family neurotransmitter:Na+ symporter